MDNSIGVEYERGGRANLGGQQRRENRVTSRQKLDAEKEDTPGQVRRYNSAGKADNN